MCRRSAAVMAGIFTDTIALLGSIAFRMIQSGVGCCRSRNFRLGRRAVSALTRRDVIR